jgi:16S rRNA (uracil1498-N3)-methyltransferase
MECLYIPELKTDSKEIMIIGEEFRHLWALRTKVNEPLLLTNGNGICGIARLTAISKNTATASITETLSGYGENKTRVGLGIGILDSRERMEFALEKSVELGATDFYPIICQFSQKQNVSVERLHSKAIAAMKQCKRSILPTIHTPMTVAELIEHSQEWTTVLIADVSGQPLHSVVLNETTLIVVGTEGGFSPKEIQLLNNDSRTAKISLGNRRLRAETASMVALSLLTNINIFQ